MKYLVTALIMLFITYSPFAFGQYTSTPVTVSQETFVKNGIIYYVHKVEKNQTIFSIAKVYSTSMNSLIDQNPQIKDGLKEGTVLTIRKGYDPMGKTITHIVKWYENLAIIAFKYKISEDDLIQFNSLKDNKITQRQALKIPIVEGVNINKEDLEKADHAQLKKDAELKKEVPVKNEEPLKIELALNSSSVIKKEVYNSDMSRSYNVSLVLPVGSNVLDGQDGNNNFLDFYQGFLLAVEDMKEEGMSIKLKVIDLSDYSNSTLLVQSGKLDGSDIIIGPIFLNDVEPVAEFSNEKYIPLVSPMDPKTETLVDCHPYFYQVSTSPYDQQLDLLKNISPNNSATLIYESSGSDRELVGITEEILNNLGIRFSSLSYNVLSGRSISPKIADKLSKESMNDIIVVSNSEAFVSDVLRNLNLLSSRNNYKITIYGTPRWRNFENVDISYYHSMNLHLSMQYYVDYSNENVKRFLARYRALYGAEPTPYSYQAYDVAYYFLGALYNIGQNFSDRISGFSRELLQTDLRFVRKNNSGGFINNTTRQIIYNPDYSIYINRLNR